MPLPGQKDFEDILNEISDEIMGVTYTALAADADESLRPGITALKRIVNDCQRDICTGWDWWFMYRQFDLSIVAGQTTPHFIDSTAEEILWMNITASNQKLNWMSMTDWRNMYPNGFSAAGASLPYIYIPAMPGSTAGTLVPGYYIFPKADQNYTATYGSRLLVADMTGVGDYPVIPAQWQGMLLALAKKRTLEYLSIPTTDQRVQAYDRIFQEILAKAWLQDQNADEAIRQFRNARAERANAMSNNYTQGVWISAGDLQGMNW